jgi:hypothetical protein
MKTELKPGQTKTVFVDGVPVPKWMWSGWGWEPQQDVEIETTPETLAAVRALEPKGEGFEGPKFGEESRGYTCYELSDGTDVRVYDQTWTQAPRIVATVYNW